MNIENCICDKTGPDTTITSEDWLEARIATWPHDEWAALVSFIYDEWDHSYGRIEETEDEVRFITGGWSDNEFLIGALRQNHMVYALYWQSSHRGGLEVYRKKP